MRLYYHTGPKPGNFGDILNKWLVETISGQQVSLSPPGPEVHICIGSIIKFVQPNMHVWGTGAMRLTDKPSKHAYYYAVRGPATQQVVFMNGGNCPDVYGDPALLLPKFYNPTVEKKHKLGILPHYVDYQAVKEKYPQHRVINLLNADPLQVTKEILECEETVSSSLHGLIVSQAYGIPCALVDTIQGKLSGDGTKFTDYFLSTGQDPYNPLPFKDFESIDKTADIKINLKALLNACPFYKAKLPYVVSFYTADYKQHAHRLENELKKLKLDYEIQSVAPIGEWIDNTRLKGKLVYDALMREKRDVLWVDADSSVHKEPRLFASLDADFAAWNKLGERPWSVGHLWFNYTPKGIELCRSWAKWCEEAPAGVSDEWALTKAWEEVQGVKTHNLPRDYFASTITKDTVLSYRLSGNAQKFLKGN
jgi:pyruvyltransferase